MKRRPANTAALLRAAHGFHSSRRLAAAASLYNQILDIDRNNFDALHLNGVCTYQLGRKAEALELLSRALTVRQDVASVFSHRAIVLHALGQHADAVRDLDQAIDLAPTRAELHFNKGNVLRDQKRLDEARLSFEAALELDRGNASYLNNLAGVLEESGQHRDALECLDRLVDSDPSNPDVHVNRALVLQRLGRSGEAICGYDKAIALRPGLVTAYTFRGNALLEANRLDEAHASYDSALRLKPDDPFVLCKRGRVLNVLNRSGQALADYDMAIRLKPDLAEAYYGRGIALQNLNRLRGALQSYERAIVLAGENAELLRRRGDVQRKLGLLNEAHASFEMALRHDPALAAIRVSRGNAFADEEEWEPAREEYELALHIDQGLRDALRGLSKLPVGTLARERVTELLAIVETVSYAADPAAGLFTKAGLLEKLKRYDEAFACIKDANRHRLEALTDMTGDSEFWQQCAEQRYWSPVAAEARPVETGGGTNLLVILGPSRSGKTSLERLLCRDGRFFRGDEGDDANAAIQRLKELQAGGATQGEPGRGVLQALFSIAGGAPSDGGHEVHTLTNPFLLPGAHRIFDLHERSYFVFVERDPLDVAAEIFRKDYRSSSPFSCRADLALSHAVRYLEATSVLQARMKGRCMRVTYEDLLSSPQEVRNSVHALLGIGIRADAQGLTGHKQRDPASPYRILFRQLLEDMSPVSFHLSNRSA